MPAQAKAPRIGSTRRYVTRTSCGFCEGAHGQLPGVCHDTEGHCHGTWPQARPSTVSNPEGLWTCRCSTLNHPGRPPKT